MRLVQKCKNLSNEFEALKLCLLPEKTWCHLLELTFLRSTAITKNIFIKKLNLSCTQLVLAPEQNEGASKFKKIH